MTEKEQLKILKSFLNDLVDEHGAVHYTKICQLLEKHQLIKSYEEDCKKVDWLRDDFPEHKKPCGECHLSIGEICDICGAIEK